jgi:hypothetical protein
MKKFLASALGIMLLSPLSAEEVEILRSDKVVMVDESYVDLGLQNRSRIRKAHYQPTSGQLLVQLNGRDQYIEYCNVPEEVANQFARVPSTTKYYRDNVKREYKCDSD